MSAPIGIFDSQDCGNPECEGTAEPEQDGNHRYWACEECGFEFGWVLIESQTIALDESCQVGIPESVRRRASGPMEAALANEAKSAPVPLEIGFRRSG